MFYTRKSRGAHRRFCKNYQKILPQILELRQQRLQYECNICFLKYKSACSLRKHIINSDDEKHKLFLQEQIKIAITSLKSDLTNRNIKGFILGRKFLSKIISKYIDTNDLKHNRYRQTTFICKQCNQPFKARQSVLFICKKCKALRKRVYKIYGKKCLCIICKKQIRKNQLGYCRQCLNNTKQGKAIYSKSFKGINKGNPGWARVKKSNNYIEQKVADILKTEFDVQCQKQINKFRVDMYLPKYNIVVECDGKQHYLDTRQFNHDKKRDVFLITNGYRVIRFNAIFIKYKWKEIMDIVQEFVKSTFNRQLNYAYFNKQTKAIELYKL